MSNLSPSAYRFKSADKEEMKFIWVIGIEGSGHHMVFDAMFHNLKDRKNFLYESDGTGELLDTGFTAVEELKAA